MASDTQNPTQAIEISEPELEQMVADGIRLGLERWHENCPCCFSDAYPGGLEQAVEQLKG